MSAWMRASKAALLGLAALAAGCEGWDRNQKAPVDLSRPPEKVAESRSAEGVQLADELERMGQLRGDYLQQLSKLERVYLERGDNARAAWARRQREETAAITVYPYGTNQASEQTTRVRPERPIPEADRLYDEANALVQSFRGVPLAGVLDANKNKARKAIRLWKELINKHPTSDKVDDAAFWIGECYKEYLREEDPDNMLALRYYRWANELDPKTPHPARFQTAVVLDYRLHDHAQAINWYRRVIDENENCHATNIPFARDRIRELTDETHGRDRPQEEKEPSVVDAENDPARQSTVAGTPPTDEPPAQDPQTPASP